jgi:NADH-quinone oxidoreductase subunit E
MLTEAEKREIEVELGRYPEKRAAAPEAMKIVMRRTGWISDDDLREIAAFLQMSPAELDGVATGYNLIFRRPVGQHVILICDSVSCWIMGYEPLREHLMAKLGIGLGQTTPDGRFTLLPVCCLGACDHAPAMMIDEDFHGDLDAAGIDRILEAYP